MNLSLPSNWFVQIGLIQHSFQNLINGSFFRVNSADLRIFFTRAKLNLPDKIWQCAVQSKWNKNPVWIHGDLASGNILLKNNHLVGVIDFGGMAIGDPACDLTIAWTLFKKESRQIFRQNLDLDEDTWNRARGWALWKAAIELVSSLDNKDVVKANEWKRLIDEVQIIN